MNFIISKSSGTRQITPVNGDISSKVPVSTSLFSHARHWWLTIVMSLIAVAGIMGIVGIAVVSFAVLRPTRLSSKLSRWFN